MTKLIDGNGFWLLILAVIFLLIVCVWPNIAKSDDYNVNFGVSRGYSISGPHGSTVVAPLGSASPRIITVPPHDIDRIRDLRWRVRCRPAIKYDGNGVGHYIYAANKKGCDVGLHVDPEIAVESEEP